jgi:hypothetical protein
MIHSQAVCPPQAETEVRAKDKKHQQKAARATHQHQQKAKSNPGVVHLLSNERFGNLLKAKIPLQT